jgi:hypothetical protein
MLPRFGFVAGMAISVVVALLIWAAYVSILIFRHDTAEAETVGLSDSPQAKSDAIMWGHTSSSFVRNWHKHNRGWAALNLLTALGRLCPLLGVKRTSRFGAVISAFHPKRTVTMHHKFCFRESSSAIVASLCSAELGATAG